MKKFTEFLTEVSTAQRTPSQKGDYVVCHTSSNYSPMVTVVKSAKMAEYFNENNGFDDDMVNKIKMLKSAKTFEEFGLIIVKL